MTTKALPWMPPNGDDVELVQVGLYWDAVRVSADVGECALTLFAEASGAVIADYGLMYWLIPASRAQDWRSVQQVRALGAQGVAVTYVGVPPAGWTDGPRLHWRIPVGPDRYLTDPERLREALVRVIAAEAAEGGEGPVSVQVCARCQTTTRQPAVVAIGHGASAGGGTVYACPDCAPTFPQQRDPFDGTAMACHDTQAGSADPGRDQN